MADEKTWKRIAPHRLTWPEVDPARHPFDATEALDVVRALAPPVPAPPSRSGHGLVGREEPERWRDAVSHALVDRYGRWACGWCWSVGEGDYDGGPVNEWCCVAHSITSAEETLALVADSLVQWRGWLETLAAQFNRFLPLPAPQDTSGDVIVAWEVAVAQLVNLTVDRTHSDSAWYGHCEQVLTWFLTAARIPRHRHSTLLTDAIGGRFRSWIQPSVSDVTEVAERFAQQVAGLQQREPAVQSGSRAEDWPDTWPPDWPSPRTVKPLAPAPRSRQRSVRPDSLQTWRTVRANVNWNSAANHVSGPAHTDRDAIADRVAQRPEGSRELSAALDQVRQAATEGGPLTFALLARWQRIVLGVPEARFRTGPAAAKGGRERYYWNDNLPQLFEEYLAEATSDDLPLPSRAARVYLDVAFFHPFDDGNARSAMLALYYVLAREEVVLDRAAPLLVTVRQAHDRYGAAGLAKLVELLINATRQRMLT